MKALYYIHTPTDWDADEINSIKREIEALDIEESIDAAIGEGAGGAGLETVVEVLLDDPIITGLVSTVVYEIAKVLWRRRPTRKHIPQGLPEKLDAYRLVVHVEGGVQNTIVSVDLKSDLKDIETSVTVKLEDKLKEKPTRLFQNGDDWDAY